MTNRSGGVRSTASPSIPAWTGAGAVTSSCAAVHVRPGLWPATRRVEDEDAELSAVECRPRAGCMRRVRASRGCSTRARPRGPMRAAAVVHELQAGCGGARSEHLRGRLQQRARLGVAVGRLPNGVAVDPERDVVEEEAAVHLGHVDPALDAVGEGVERADQVARGRRRRRARSGCGCRRGRRRTEGRARERLRPRRRASRRRRRRRARPRRAPRRRRRALRGRRSGRRTITSMPRSRARSARPARVALPPPDLGLTKSTGRCGGSAADQMPRVIRRDGPERAGELGRPAGRDRARGRRSVSRLPR